MIRIETERDIERLRQIALLQQAELTRLHARLATLTRELAAARGHDALEALQLELTLLHEQLAARTRELFGPSSEQRKRAGAGAAPRRTDPQTGHGPREQATLPLVEVVHVLDEPDQQCPKCGGELRAWDGQFETSEEVDVVERSFRLVRHHRQKYTCACGACIETALGPRKLVPGGRYALDFALAVAVAKYADHAPLARQVRQMARAGLRVDTQTLWDQLLALAQHLVPTYDALWRSVLAAPVVLFDETRWPLLGSATAAKWHAWAAASEDAIAYRILGARSGKAAEVVLGDFSGIAVTDGYDVYQSLCADRAARATGPPAFSLAHCWSQYLESDVIRSTLARCRARVGGQATPLQIKRGASTRRHRAYQWHAPQAADPCAPRRSRASGHPHPASERARRQDHRCLRPVGSALPRPLGAPDR